jgi:hypothetical protein
VAGGGPQPMFIGEFWDDDFTTAGGAVDFLPAKGVIALDVLLTVRTSKFYVAHTQF